MAASDYRAPRNPSAVFPEGCTLASSANDPASELKSPPRGRAPGRWVEVSPSEAPKQLPVLAAACQVT
jgi:hypothetical protein